MVGQIVTLESIKIKGFVAAISLIFILTCTGLAETELCTGNSTVIWFNIYLNPLAGVAVI